MNTALLSRISLLLALAGCPPTGLEPVDSDTEVEEGDVIGILISPERVVVPLGEEVQLKAVGLTADRRSTDLTHAATWGSSDPSVAAVDQGLDREGMVRGVAAGEARVWAEVQGIRSPEAKVQVSEASLLGLTLEPKTATVAQGATVQLKAIAAFTDGERSEATTQVQWITDNASVARVDGGGLMTGAGLGTTTVRAEWQGQRPEPIEITVVAGTASKPDLEIVELRGDAADGEVTVTVRVRNSGGVGVADAFIDVFLDPASTPAPGALGDKYVFIPYIDAGGFGEVTLSFDGLADGTHSLYALVDTDNAIDESNESNNGLGASFSLGGATVTGPNLVVSYFDFIADATSVYYVVDVKNTGSADVGEFFVDVFVDRATAPRVPDDGDGWTRVASLARGATETADFLISRPCTSTCKSWVLIDSYDEVAETREDDNLAGPISVRSE
jgi:hypothetical protein